MMILFAVLVGAAVTAGLGYLVGAFDDLPPDDGAAT